MGTEIRIDPSTPASLPALGQLFESDGITRGRWCMHWRLDAKAWRLTDSGGRRRGFEDVVVAGTVPGLVALSDGAAIGWVQVTPLADMPRFNAAGSARPEVGAADVDRTGALSCFFMHKDARGSGLMTTLTRAACAHAAAAGAAAVGAAPIAATQPLTWGADYVGIVSALERAGFSRAEQRTKRRWLMRWTPPGAGGRP